MTTTSGRPALTRGRLTTERDAGFEAFWMLRLAFTVAPIAFGLDKFFDVLVEWEIYLADDLVRWLPGDATELMYAVGVIEIVAGVVVFLRPRFGSFLVAAWLLGIIVDLLMVGDFYDVALRDFGLLLAALTLARLAATYDPDPLLTRPAILRH
ncbi:DoxX family membrane protein [Sporichthya brevicatena]|uniref:DoxX family membrane protein n=1 Tax=Sporichthya brevicatena TaxID=171442 RepID=A0ABN1G4R7_9ACTN